MSEVDIVLEYLPFTIKNIIKENFKEDYNIEEIRLRNSKPLSIKTGQDIKQLNYIVKQQDMLQALEKICENSIYSYTRQICDGYITIRGGNRVGLTGSAVIDNGKIINMNYISSLNVRIARQKIGCSNRIIEDIIDLKNNSIYNTLIISPPGCGKTTLLRDIVRNISNGITVGVVDERGEIAAMYKGVAQNDVGTNTDIIDNMPKAQAMKMLVRSMSPKAIACDEIGGKNDIEAIDYAMCSGIKGIFTAHGKDLEEINKNPEISKLLDKHIFERIILLNPSKRGEAECIGI